MTAARLRFLGAAREVTGSMFLLELPTGSLLIDCGLVQGRREESRHRNRHLPAAVVGADAVILTHAHVDHSGNLPSLVKAGFQGRIHCTPATADLSTYMLRDSAHIHTSDAAYLNRKMAGEPGWTPITPLYDDQDALRALERFQAVDYHTAFEPLPGVTATFLDAGHILGSAVVVLDFGAGTSRRRLVMSGDLGRRGLPILKDPEVPGGPVDHLVMESTYGATRHGSVRELHDDVARVVTETMARGGKIVVPAFAVGRTQELLYVLHELRVAGRIPAIPTFLDSPLAIDVTGVFRRHPECFDAAMRALVEAHGEVFALEGVTITRTAEESMHINEVDGPALIISASGMAEAGRVLHHLRNTVEDPRNTILLVGFMAQHTLGRRLAERRPWVKIWGLERELRARVEVLHTFSAHADRDDLLAYARACGDVRQTFLVHGEPEQQDPLAAALRAEQRRVIVPLRGEVFDLE